MGNAGRKSRLPPAVLASLAFSLFHAVHSPAVAQGAAQSMDADCTPVIATMFCPGSSGWKIAQNRHPVSVIFADPQRDAVGQMNVELSKGRSLQELMANDQAALKSDPRFVSPPALIEDQSTRFLGMQGQSRLWLLHTKQHSSFLMVTCSMPDRFQICASTLHRTEKFNTPNRDLHHSLVSTLTYWSN